MKKCIWITFLCSLFIACGKKAPNDFATKNNVVVDYLEKAIGDNDHVSESDLLFLEEEFGPVLPYDTISNKENNLEIYIPKRDVVLIFACHHYNVSLEIAESLTQMYHMPGESAGVNYEDAYSLYCFLIRCEKEGQLDYIVEYLQYICKEKFSQHDKSLVTIYSKAMSNSYRRNRHVSFDINIVKEVVKARYLIEQAIPNGPPHYTEYKSRFIDKFYRDVREWIEKNDLSELPRCDSDADYYLFNISFQVGYEKFRDDINNIEQSAIKRWNNNHRSQYGY